MNTNTTAREIITDAKVAREAATALRVIANAAEDKAKASQRTADIRAFREAELAADHAAGRARYLEAVAK